MPRARIALICLSIALVGLGVSVRASLRVAHEERRLAELADEARAAGESFAATLQGEHAERQRLAFDARRAVALSLAAARRDRLLGILAAVGAALAAAGLSMMSRIALEVEEDRRHVAGQGRNGDGPAEP
jgi:hypothetical protein